MEIPNLTGNVSTIGGHSYIWNVIVENPDEPKTVECVVTDSKIIVLSTQECIVAAFKLMYDGTPPTDHKWPHASDVSAALAQLSRIKIELAGPIVSTDNDTRRYLVVPS